MLTPKDMLWSQPRGQHLSSHWIVQTHGRILLQCISPVRSEPDQEAAAKFQCAFKIKVCVEGITVQVWVHMCANGAHACVYMSLWRSLLQLPLPAILKPPLSVNLVLTRPSRQGCHASMPGIRTPAFALHCTHWASSPAPPCLFFFFFKTEAKKS